MLEARNIGYSFVPGSTPVFEHMSLTIAPGEFVALTGCNGSGKTTLARIMAGSLKPQVGWVALDGDTAQACWPHVGYVRQDPRTQLVSEIVYDEVAFGLETAGVPQDQIRARVHDALVRCGIAHLEQTLTTGLSGGEQQRLALAGVLAANPTYLILDEPTTFLDMESRSSFIRLLRDLAHKGTGILLVTHRKEEMQAADRVVRMGEQYEERANANKKGDKPLELFGFGTGHSLYVEGATVHRGTVRALDDVSVIAPTSEITLIMGRSGAGKSTLALTMAGVLRPKSGIAFLGDESVRIGEVDLCMQRPEDQLFCPTVIEDVMYGPRNAGLSEDEARIRATQALLSLGIRSELWQRHSLTLSGGERRRVAIACSLAMDYDAYVFDEPTAGLDERGCVLMCDLAQALAEAGKAVVVISHDVDIWYRIAQTVVRLSSGRVVYAGEVRELSDIPADKAPVDVPRHTMSDTVLDVLPAGVKVIGLLLATITLFWTQSYVVIGACLVMALLVTALAGIHPKDVPQHVGILAVVFVFAIASNALVLDGSGDVLVAGAVGVSREGLVRGAKSVLRIITLVLLVTAVAHTTPASKVAKAVLVPLRPLQRLGVPVQTLDLTVSLALRSLPFGFEEYARIETAQRIRRAKLGKGPVTRRLSNWLAVLVPLIVALMRHADELGDALADRGYGR